MEGHEERTAELTPTEAKEIADKVMGTTDREAEAQVNSAALADFILRGD